MQFTGERMIPEFNKENEIYLEHYSRYMFAAQFVANKEVLDIASGSGYGVDLFCKSGAKKVYGVDISQEATEYAEENYGQKNAKFLEGDLVDIPLDENSVDVIVSFETIEHVDESSQIKFLDEVNRVLRPNGTLLISTPNIEQHADDNEFHLKELNFKEFDSILKKHFEYRKFLYQDNTISNYIFSADSLQRDSLVDRARFKNVLVEKLNNINHKESLFLLAVCSREGENLKQVNEMITLFNINPFRQLKRTVRSYKDEITKHQETYKKLLKDHQESVREKDAYIESLKETLSKKDQYIKEITNSKQSND